MFSFLPYDLSSAASFFGEVVSSGFWLLAGMYPTIVIYLVNQQNSLDEVFALSAPNGNGLPGVPFNRAMTTGPLAFAHSNILTENTSSREPAEPKHTHKGDGISPIEYIAGEKAHDMA
ncbi:hypothetical protein C0992_002959 [Termitomyces sp. T32_za158]|nr:hypothetical protein C0992_002959 [Termitomyces sp. T32_za158]